jgi:hypothetical protein
MALFLYPHSHDYSTFKTSIEEWEVFYYFLLSRTLNQRNFRIWGDKPDDFDYFQ